MEAPNEAITLAEIEARVAERDHLRLIADAQAADRIALEATGRATVAWQVARDAKVVARAAQARLDALKEVAATP